MDRDDVKYTHTHTHTMEYHLAIKKNEITPSATTWMDPGAVTCREINQTEKDKCCMLSFLCGI